MSTLDVLLRWKLQRPKSDTPIIVELTGDKVYVNDVGVNLTTKEYALFRRIASQGGKVCTKLMILESLYPDSKIEAQQKIVDVFICKIRRKLDAVSVGAGQLVKTVWGRGHAVTTKTIPKERWVVSRKAALVKRALINDAERSAVLTETPHLSTEELHEWIFARSTQRLRSTYAYRLRN